MTHGRLLTAYGQLRAVWGNDRCAVGIREDMEEIDLHVTKT